MDSPIDITPLQAARVEVDTYVGGLDGLLALEVANDAQADYAGTVATQLGDAKKAFLAKRDAGLHHARALLAWAESILPLETVKRIDRVIDHLKKSTNAYVQRKREEAARALVEARSHEEVQRSVQAVAPAIPAGFVEQATWTWELVDPSQVPRDYWQLDEKRLDREVRASKDRFNVPGFRVVQGSKLNRSGRR